MSKQPSPSTDRGKREAPSASKLIRAAKAVVRSEIPNLRNRIGDGYAVVEAKALDALLNACGG